VYVFCFSLLLFVKLIMEFCVFLVYALTRISPVFKVIVLSTVNKKIRGFLCMYEQGLL
jgi:hypothetical protein